MDRQIQEVMGGTVPTMSYMMKVPNMGWDILIILIETWNADTLK